MPAQGTACLAILHLIGAEINVSMYMALTRASVSAELQIYAPARVLPKCNPLAFDHDPNG